MTRVLHRTYGYGVRGRLAYFGNRALRIYPAYWATFALSLLWLLLAPESPPSTLMVHIPGSAAEYVRSLVAVRVVDHDRKRLALGRRSG